MKTNPKETGVLFNGDMVRAINSGNKTCTRRILKNQESYSGWNYSARVFDHPWMQAYLPGATDSSFVLQEHEGDLIDSKWQPIGSPFGSIGDLIYVRETHAKNTVLPLSDRPQGDYIYRADLNDLGQSKFCGTWTPSIHMSKSAARIWLKITDVRIERLQDIDPEDCIAEGIQEHYGVIGVTGAGGHHQEICGYWYTHPRCDESFGNAVDAFESLWVSIYGAESWDANPWVFAYSFKKIDRKI